MFMVLETIITGTKRGARETEHTQKHKVDMAGFLIPERPESLLYGFERGVVGCVFLRKGVT